MKTYIAFLSLLVLSLSLAAAETTPDPKSPAKPKAPAAEAAKPSAKVEAAAKTLTAPQRDQLLSLLNNGDQAALMAIPGIGEVRAKAIQKVRPLADVTHVVNADGVGEGIFGQMVAYAKAGFQPPEKKAASTKKKSTPKKADSKDAK